jgi:DNA-binding CsgD family transcriptional regulator
MNEFEISEEFIEEGKNLVKPRQKSAPYTKLQRLTRRNEVFKLHFEYGYPASTIADMMKINRNTINGDISFWYSKIKLDVEKIDVNHWFGKQLYRLESQRTRLRKQLDKSLTIEQSLSVEKIIIDLDSRITNLYWKVATSDDPIHKKVQSNMNSYLKKMGMKHRMVSNFELNRIPKEEYDKITKIMGRVKI